MEIPCQGQNQRDFHQFGWLQLEKAKVDPALCTHADIAFDFDPDKEHKGNEIGQIGQLEPDADIGYRDDDHQGRTNAKAHHLTFCPWLKRSVCCRIQHGKPDPRKRRDQGNQCPVQE